MLLVHVESLIAFPSVNKLLPAVAISLSSFRHVELPLQNYKQNEGQMARNTKFHDDNIQADIALHSPL